jgi:hypothetical protein
MKSYYIYRGEDEMAEGPYDVDALADMVRANSLSGEHYLWSNESTGWVRADTLLPQLFGQAPASAAGQKQLVNFSSITNNPFRILGISIDASEREKLKMLKTAKAYIKVGKAVTCETDFDLSVEPARGEDELEDAQSKIQQVEGRLRHAHMWFWEGNSLDKKAFQHFKAGELQEGTDLLERNVARKGVSANNYSSVRNLGLFYLDRSTTQGSLDSSFLTVGIQNLGSFCDSEFFDGYSSVAGDKRSQISSHKLQEQIVDDIYQPLKGAIDTGVINLKELLDAFNTFPERLRKYLSDKFTSGPVSDIETDVAKMMRRCATEYHNERLEDGEDPGEQSLEIAKLALKVCATGTMGQNLKDDIEWLEEWNRNKASREKQKAVASEIEELVGLLDGAKEASGYGALAAANALINQGQPILNRIRSVLGAHDEEYKNMSDVVAWTATNALIEYANATDDCAAVVPLMEKIGHMEMSQETMDYWSRNIHILRDNVSEDSGDGGWIGCAVIIGCILLYVLYNNF